ncbi:MAG: sensor histidine kinase N-terminal domain-containing protein [Sterolibacteriaceae bacterium]|nr:sensor histidine kinase N-terminal domain-containing protein [Candidatus Methylophosphatis haderslevensis]
MIPRALNWLALRMLLLTLLVVAVCGGIAVMISYRNALHEADELLDAQMAESAQTLLALNAQHGPATPAVGETIAGATGEPRHKYQIKLMFQLWHDEASGAHLVLRSPNAPAAMLLGGQQAGFVTADWQGRPWRFYSQRDPAQSMLAIVGQDFAIREELATETARHGVVPFVAGLPVLALLLFIAIRAACAPVRRLADDLATRDPDNLQPVAIGNVAREIEPVTDALNRLFARLESTLQNERRFTADAAHELRNPLAALIAQLQVAQMGEGGGEGRSVLKKCEHGARRMSHLVEQMLTLSRLDVGPAAPAREPLDLAAETAAVCADLGPAAIAGGLALALDAPGPLPLRGQAELLRVMLRNLIDNAIRYTPAGGRIDVSLMREGAWAVCAVQDDGPGVPADQLALLGQRFRRLGPHEVEGVGLGLSIVRRIVELHGGRIDFANIPSPHGLRVTLRLPATGETAS